MDRISRRFDLHNPMLPDISVEPSQIGLSEERLSIYVQALNLRILSEDSTSLLFYVPH